MAVLRSVTLPAAALFVFATVVPPLHADSTIDATDKYSYGANVGWINWRPSAPDGAVIGQKFCSGHVYSANCGWIDLGDGTPDNGIAYSNTSATDYGVNVTSLNTFTGEALLEGSAYGANIGWITFEQAQGQPKFNPTTGQFTGHAYGANVGWIDLANGVETPLTTETIDCGPDTDTDLIPDWWELERVTAAGLMPVDLSHLSETTDSDGDGETDLDEFLADTNPFDPGDTFRIVTFSVNDPMPNDIALAWTSSTTRLYDIQQVLFPGFLTLATDLVPDAGASTSILVNLGPLPPRGFTRIVAKPPLKP